jgi:transcriptional regulator with XRE-family HTH domain
MLRAEHGWRQEDLAERLGVSRAAVTQWESGRRRPRAVLVLKIEMIEEAEGRRLTAEGKEESCQKDSG